MARARFEWSSSELGTRLAEFPIKLQERLVTTIDLAAPKAQQIMQERAPWTQTGEYSRWGRLSTGEARSNLYATAQHEGSGPYMTHTITLGNRLPRARFLEIAMSGRFAIIEPTRDAVGRSIMVAFDGLLSELDAPAAVEIADPVIVTPSAAQIAERSADREAFAPFGSVRRRVTEIFKRSPNVVRRIGWKRR